MNSITHTAEKYQIGTKTAAAEYIERGFSIVPVPYGTKAPVIKKWESVEFITGDFKDGDNIGMKPSNGLVDIDLDCHEAAEIAPHFLPPTYMVGGRKSNPLSHYWFCSYEATNKKYKDEDNKMLLERRATGYQTVVYPSVHPSGEQYTWNGEEWPGEALEVDSKELEHTTDLIAATTLLARNWPKGEGSGRHYFALAVAGFLARGGLDEEIILEMVEYAATVAEDDEVEDRLKAVRDTVGNLGQDSHVTGGKTLIEYLGERSGTHLLSKLTEWLGLRSQVKQSKIISQRENSTISLEEAHYSDMGNAEQLVKRYGHKIRYVHQWGWMVYDGKRWKRDTTGTVERYAKETVRSFYGVAASMDDDHMRKTLVDHARKSESHQRLRAMIATAASEASIVASPEDFDTDLMLFNVANGTIDLRTGELLAHREDDLITKVSSVEYTPRARGDLWERFLDDITVGDKELQTYLQRAIGYSMTGSTSEECLFICYGAGRNGKSKFLTAIEYVMGDYGKATRPETLLSKERGGASNDVAALAGARYVVTSETEDGKKLDISLVKQLTGGDMLTARFLHQEFFNFKAELKLWLTTNHKPDVTDVTTSIWERIKLIPFDAHFGPEKRDKNLEAKLQAIAPAILAWMVEGCLQWQAEGLSDPDRVKVATEDYRKENDPIADFFDEKCEVGTGMVAKFQDLHRAFQQWEASHNVYKPTSSKQFALHLKERGFSDGRVGKAKERVYYGIAVKSTDPINDTPLF